MDAGGREGVGPYDYQNYSSAMESLPDDQVPSTVHYADEGWVQTETFVDLSEKFSDDKPKEFEEHLRKRKSETTAQQKLNKRQKITFEDAVNQAESLLENDIDLVNEVLKQRFNEVESGVESQENVFLDVRIHNQSDEFVEKIFGGKISHRFVEKSDQKIPSSQIEKHQTEKRVQHKQKKSKPQAKILPVVRRDSFNVEEEKSELHDEKPPYPMEVETVQQMVDQTKPTSNFRANQFGEETNKRGTAVGRALNELLETSHPSNQWKPSYDVPDRSDDPDAMKIIGVAVIGDESSEEDVANSIDGNEVKMTGQQQGSGLKSKEAGSTQQAKRKVHSTKDQSGKKAKTEVVSKNVQDELPVDEEPKTNDVLSNKDAEQKAAKIDDAHVKKPETLTDKREKAESDKEEEVLLPVTVPEGQQTKSSASTKKLQTSEKLEDSIQTKEATILEKPAFESTSNLLDAESPTTLTLEEKSSVEPDERKKQAKRKTKDLDEKSKVQKMSSIDLEAELENQQKSDFNQMVIDEKQVQSFRKRVQRPKEASARNEVNLGQSTEDNQRTSTVSNKAESKRDAEKLTRSKDADMTDLQSDEESKPNVQQLTELNAEFTKTNASDFDEVIKSEQERDSTSKSTNKFGKKSTTLDSTFDKTAESKEEGASVPETQKSSTKKSVPKSTEAATNLDAQMNKLSDVEGCSANVPNNQQIEVGKTTKQPSLHSSTLDAELEKPTDSQKVILEKQDQSRLKAKKSVSKPGQQSADLDAAFEETPGVESDDLTVPESGQMSSSKTMNKPGANSTKLDVGLEKFDAQEASEVSTQDDQRSETTKKTQEPSQKSTKLNVAFEKLAEAESQEVVSREKQDFKSSKKTNEPSQKSTKVDADFEKMPETENINSTSLDSPKTDARKQVNEPTQRSTKLDAAFEKLSELENVDSTSPSQLQDVVTQKMHEPGQKSTKLDAAFEKLSELENVDSTSPDSPKTDTRKQVNEPTQKSTKLDAQFERILDAESQELVSTDRPQDIIAKQVSQPSQKSTRLDADFEKLPEVESQELVSTEKQKLKSSKKANEPSQKSTKLDAQFEKLPETENISSTSLDSPKTDATKQTHKPGKKTTKIDVNFEKLPEVESQELVSTEKQQLKSSKNANEPSQKSTKLDAQFDKTPEFESDKVTSPERQQFALNKNANEPSQKSTKLDVQFDKTPELENAELASVEGPKTNAKKQTNEPSQKSTKLDAQFEKLPDAESQELISTQKQQDIVAKQMNEPSQKSARLDAQFDKSSEIENANSTSLDSSTINAKKQVNEPSQKSTKLDAQFDKQPKMESNEVISPDKQDHKSTKQTHEPSQKSIKLDAQFNKLPETKASELVSSDAQTSKATKRTSSPSKKSTKLDANHETDEIITLEQLTAAKTTTKPGTQSTNLDAEFSKSEVSDHKEAVAPDGQQSKATKRTSNPSKKSTTLDAEFDKTSHSRHESVSLPETQQTDASKSTASSKQRSTKVDAEFDNALTSENAATNGLDTQKESAKTHVSPPSHQTTDLNAEFNQTNVSQSEEMISPEKQKLKTSKTAQKSGETATKLDANLSKKPVEDEMEQIVPEARQITTKKSTPESKKKVVLGDNSVKKTVEVPSPTEKLSDISKKSSEGSVVDDSTMLTETSIDSPSKKPSQTPDATQIPENKRPKTTKKAADKTQVSEKVDQPAKDLKSKKPTEKPDSTTNANSIKQEEVEARNDLDDQTDKLLQQSKTETTNIDATLANKDLSQKASYDAAQTQKQSAAKRTKSSKQKSIDADSELAAKDEEAAGEVKQFDEQSTLKKSTKSPSEKDVVPDVQLTNDAQQKEKSAAKSPSTQKQSDEAETKKRELEAAYMKKDLSNPQQKESTATKVPNSTQNLEEGSNLKLGHTVVDAETEQPEQPTNLKDVFDKSVSSTQEPKLVGDEESLKDEKTKLNKKTRSQSKPKDVNVTKQQQAGKEPSDTIGFKHEKFNPALVNEPKLSADKTRKIEETEDLRPIAPKLSADKTLSNNKKRVSEELSKKTPAIEDKAHIAKPEKTETPTNLPVDQEQQTPPKPLTRKKTGSSRKDVKIGNEQAALNEESAEQLNEAAPNFEQEFADSQTQLPSVKSKDQENRQALASKKRQTELPTNDLSQNELSNEEPNKDVFQQIGDREEKSQFVNVSDGRQEKTPLSKRTAKTTEHLSVENESTTPNESTSDKTPTETESEKDGEVTSNFAKQYAVDVEDLEKKLNAKKPMKRSRSPGQEDSKLNVDLKSSTNLKNPNFEVQKDQPELNSAKTEAKSKEKQNKPSPDAKRQSYEPNADDFAITHFQQTTSQELPGNEDNVEDTTEMDSTLSKLDDLSSIAPKPGKTTDDKTTKKKTKSAIDEETSKRSVELKAVFDQKQEELSESKLLDDVDLATDKKIIGKTKQKREKTGTNERKIEEQLSIPEPTKLDEQSDQTAPLDDSHKSNLEQPLKQKLTKKTGQLNESSKFDVEKLPQEEIEQQTVPTAQNESVSKKSKVPKIENAVNNLQEEDSTKLNAHFKKTSDNQQLENVLIDANKEEASSKLDKRGKAQMPSDHLDEEPARVDSTKLDDIAKSRELEPQEEKVAEELPNSIPKKLTKPKTKAPEESVNESELQKSKPSKEEPEVDSTQTVEKLKKKTDEDEKSTETHQLKTSKKTSKPVAVKEETEQSTLSNQQTEDQSTTALDKTKLDQPPKPSKKDEKRPRSTKKKVEEDSQLDADLEKLSQDEIEQLLSALDDDKKEANEELDNFENTQKPSDQLQKLTDLPADETERQIPITDSTKTSATKKSKQAKPQKDLTEDTIEDSKKRLELTQQRSVNENELQKSESSKEELILANEKPEVDSTQTVEQLEKKVDEDEKPTETHQLKAAKKTSKPVTVKKETKQPNKDDLQLKLSDQQADKIHVDRSSEKEAKTDLQANSIPIDERLKHAEQVSKTTAESNLKKEAADGTVRKLPDSQQSGRQPSANKEELDDKTVVDATKKLTDRHKKPAITTISPELNKEQSKEKMSVRMPETVTESSTWSSPKKPPTVPQSAASDLSGKQSSEPSDGGTPSSSTTQSRYEARRLRDERASTPDNFKFVRLRKVQRVEKPIKKEVVEQPIKPKFNPKRKMISTSVGGVVVASVKLMASPEPKLSIYHGEDYMQESENLKIIVDKDKWAYTICLCIYNVSPQLSGQLSLVATNELGSDKCLLFIDVADAGKLHVGELPIVECSVADRIDALVDEDVSLQFKVRSILPPEIWIEQNGAQLSSELLTIETEGETTTVTFEIRKCKITDKAIYRCCVVNKYGSSSFTVYLNVQMKIEQSPKTPTTPVEPTRLRRKNIPGSLIIPKEINSLYGDPSVKVSLTNVTTELSATNDYAATDSSSPIKEIMSATVAKSVDASHKDGRSRRKGASRYTFNYKRTQSAPAHQLGDELKELDSELSAASKSITTKQPGSPKELANEDVKNQRVVDDLRKELDQMSKEVFSGQPTDEELAGVDKVPSKQKLPPKPTDSGIKQTTPTVDDKFGKPPKALNPQEDEVPGVSDESKQKAIRKVKSKKLPDESFKTDNSVLPSTKPQETPLDENFQSETKLDTTKEAPIEYQSNQTELSKTDVPSKSKSKKEVPPKDKTTQISSNFNKKPSEDQATIEASENIRSSAEHWTTSTKDQRTRDTSLVDDQSNKLVEKTQPVEDMGSEIASELEDLTQEKQALTPKLLTDIQRLDDSTQQANIKPTIEPSQQEASSSGKKRKATKAEKEPNEVASCNFSLNRDENERRELKLSEDVKESESSNITLGKTDFIADASNEDLLEEAKRKQELKLKFDQDEKTTGKDSQDLLFKAEDVEKQLKKTPKSKMDNEQTAEFKKDSQLKHESELLEEMPTAKLSDSQVVDTANLTDNSEAKYDGKRLKKVPKSRTAAEDISKLIESKEKAQLKDEGKMVEEASGAEVIEQKELNFICPVDTSQEKDDGRSFKKLADKKFSDPVEVISQSKDGDKFETSPASNIAEDQNLTTLSDNSQSKDTASSKLTGDQKIDLTALSDNSQLKDVKKLKPHESVLDTKLKNDSTAFDETPASKLPEDQILGSTPTDNLKSDKKTLKKRPKSTRDQQSDSTASADSFQLKNSNIDISSKLPETKTLDSATFDSQLKDDDEFSAQAPTSKLPIDQILDSKTPIDQRSLQSDESEHSTDAEKSTLKPKKSKILSPIDSVNKKEQIDSLSAIKTKPDNDTLHETPKVEEFLPKDIAQTTVDSTLTTSKKETNKPEQLEDILFNADDKEKLQKLDSKTTSQLQPTELDKDSQEKSSAKIKPSKLAKKSEQPTEDTISDTQQALDRPKTHDNKLSELETEVLPEDTSLEDKKDLFFDGKEAQSLSADKLEEDRTAKKPKKKRDKFSDDQTSVIEEIPEEPVQFTKKLEPEIIGQVGEAIELSVELSRPAQNFKWLFNKQEIPLSSEEFRITKNDDKLSLEVLKPTFGQSGTYSVMADGAITSTQLDFHGQPVLEDSADSEIELNAKDELKLKCHFEANPQPDIQILVNNQPIEDPNAVVEVTSDTITLSKPNATKKNSGIYSFVVRNTIGKAEKHIKVVVYDVPDAPQNVRVEAFGNDFVEISWSPPETGGGTTLLHYRIEMKEAKRRVFQRAGQVPASTTRFRIEGLDIDRLYLLRVAGINKFGTGEFSEPVEQMTNAPFEAPKIQEPPRIVSIDNKACKLEWSPCLDSGGSPTYSYDVYMREGDSDDWMKVNEGEVFVPSFVIKGRLEPGKSYSFKIEATNEAGISSNSNVPTESIVCPSATKSDTIDAPTVEVKSPSSVNVKWERPADLAADEELKSTVFYKSEQSPVWNQLSATGDELQITELRPELAYIFRVQTELPDSSVLSSGETSPISLKAAEKPQITKPLRDVEAIESNELRLEVQALSDSTPTFEWTKDGEELMGVQISNDGTSSVLTINLINTAHQGLYTCKITNAYGSAESSAKITVKKPPINILTAFPEMLSADIGTNLELTCELSHEDAAVNWLRNGQPLIENQRIQFVEVGAKRQLIIKNAEKEDTGDFVCVTADNNTRAKCKVSVKEPEAHVKFGPEDQVITGLGQNAIVECELTSPIESVCWLQNGRPIDLHSPKYSIVNDGLKCTLQIADFDKSSIGEFVLQLPNGELSAPANLQLKIPAKIDTDFDELTVHSGKELIFTVHLSGFPTPKLSATLNGTPLKDLALIDDIDEEHIKVSIKAMKPEYAGELLLKATNDSNEDFKSAPVNIVSVPQQPTNVSATLINNNTCEVRWSPNEPDENVTEYIVERKTGDQERWRQCSKVGSYDEPLFIAEDLSPDELIMFRIIAHNDVGRGRPSKTVDVVTEPKQEEQLNEEIAQIESALQERIEEESKPTAKWKNNGVELLWQAVENVRLYAIERRSSKNGSWIQIACTDRNWFVDRTITEPGCYSYRVIAQFEAAEQRASEPTNEVCVENEDIQTGKENQVSLLDEKEILEEMSKDLENEDPMKPSAKLTKNGVEVKWTAVGNVKLYAIGRRKTGDSIWVQLDCVRFNSYVDQTITEPGQYVYRVICQFKDDRQQASSPTNEIQIEESDLKRLKAVNELNKEESEEKTETKLSDKALESDATKADFKLKKAKESGLNDDQKTLSFEQKPSTDKTQTVNKISEDQSTKANIRKKPEAKVLPKRRGERAEEDAKSPKEAKKLELDERFLSKNAVEGKKEDSDVQERKKSVSNDVDGKVDEKSGKELSDDLNEDLKPTRDENDPEARRRRRKRLDSFEQENADTASGSKDAEEESKREVSPPIIPHIEVLDSPIELAADEEAEAVFEFKFNQIPEGATISWLKDGRPLSTVGRRKFQGSVEDGVVRLKVNGLSSDDEGDYSCRISFADTQLAECTTKLDVRRKRLQEEEPKADSTLLEPTDSRPKRVTRRASSEIEPPVPLRLLCELEDDEVKLGGSTTLTVTYSSSIVPEFKWYRNGKQIINLPGWYTVRQDGGRLLCTIENASSDDEGEWMLVAETPKGSFQTKCRITVKEPPKPMEVEKPLTHELIESALPAITRIRQRLDSENSTASSPAKRSRQIEEEPKERGDPPMFHHLLENLAAREGERVILSVTSTTIPQPNVQWYRNGILIERTNSDYIIKFDQGRFEFELLSCSKQDNAEWMAVGETRFGRCESKCMLTVLDARRQIEPYFTIGLQNQTCSVDSMLILEVNVRGVPEPQLQWFKDQQLLVHGSEYRIVGNNNLNTLTILEATKTHAGMYEVVAENSVGKAKTSCLITVNDPTHGSSKAEETQVPIVRMPLLPVREIPESTELNLVCTITGAPLPKIEWLKDDRPVVDAYFRYDNGVATMTILRAELTHSGVYTAIGSNKFGSVRTSCILYVKPAIDTNRSPPKFEDLLTDVSLLTGRELCLECRVTCRPQSSLKLTWYKDGIKMLPSNRLLQYVDRHGVVRLNLMDCRVEDAGQYGVQAENSLGQDFTHCMVRITDGSTRKSSAKALLHKPDSRAPLITRPLQDCTVHLGNQGLLECEVQACVGATAEWHQNGQLLAESRTLRAYFDGRLALLKIFNAEQSHAGEYELFIEDKHGQTSSSALVTVEDVESEHLPNMPEFTKPLEDQLIELEGNPINLCCEVRGNPTPSLIWLFNGTTLQLSNEIQSQIDGNTHTLLIQSFGPKYCGTFTAIAKNLYGEIHSSIDIQLKKND